jgi:hypothetical protein
MKCGSTWLAWASPSRTLPMRLHGRVKAIDQPNAPESRL